MLTEVDRREGGKSKDRFGHLVFDQSGVVGVWFGSAGCGEPEALVEGYGCEIVVGDHEPKCVGGAEASPGFDRVNEELAGACATVARRNPHRDELGVLRGLLVEETGSDAAILVLVICKVANRVWGAEVGGATVPVGFRELGFASVGAAEGGWCVL